MQIGSKQWIDLVIGAGDQMGIQISSEQAAQFAQHAQVLMEWNQKINLTAITDPVEMAIKHFVDAVASLHHIPVNALLLDMGTGGGFPGLPLKVMRPQQAMVLIDSVRRKINFVRHVIRLLQLTAIEAVHIRAQDLARDPFYQNRFDAIICRALTDLAGVVRLAEPLLAERGSIISLKGPSEAPPSAEGTAQDKESWQLNGEQRRFHATAWRYPLPVLGDQRSIILLKSN